MDPASPRNPADAALASEPRGYTHLEEYLNSLVPHSGSGSGR